MSAPPEYQAQQRIASARVTAAAAEANYLALVKPVSPAHAKAPAKILTSEEMYDESGLLK